MFEHNKQAIILISLSYLKLNLANFFIGTWCVCFVRVWFCHIHVNWRVPFICRRHEGHFLPKKSKNNFKFIFVLSSKMLLLFVGFPKGAAEWALWCYAICDQQHSFSNALFVTDNLFFRNHMLFYGSPTPRLYTFSFLCVESLRKCYSSRELDDGHSECGS